MILLSYNTKGLGSSVKLRALRELVRIEKIEMLLIQESKCEQIDQRVCRAIWGEMIVNGFANPQWVDQEE